MLRLVVSSICLILGSITLCQASEVTLPQPEIRFHESNSTDELGFLQTLIRANKFYEFQDYQQAAKLFSIVVKLDPSLEPAVLGLGESYISLSRPDAALEVLKNSSLDSVKVNRLKVLAQALLLEPSERELFLNLSLTKSKDQRLLNLLALTLQNKGDLTEARRAFGKAESLGQKPGVFLNNLGMLELNHGDLKAAISFFSQAIKSDPNNIRFDNNRRLALLLNGDYASALQNLETSRAASFLVDAGFIAMNDGENNLAKLMFEKANAISPVYNAHANKGLELLK
tara:strand:+ start:621 stop:1475 length:855 start_codon:yes stop_codon:yes gene_type:complete